MSKLQSINPSSLASDGLPLFLGDPNSSPDKIFPEYPWQYFLSALGLISEKYKHLSPEPDELSLRQFMECSTILDQPELEKHFIGWTHLSEYWGPTPKTAWGALINSLRPGKKIQLFKIQDDNSNSQTTTQKTNRHVDPGREISPKPIPKPSPKTAPHGSLSKKPFLRQGQDCRQWILEHQPFPLCLRVYDTVLRYCWNKGSSRGRKIYRYGQAEVIRVILKKPYFTQLQANDKGRHIRRCWSWLTKTGFFNKAWNENPDLHHNAGWFVCTSMKQVIYFKDPQKRRRN